MSTNLGNLVTTASLNIDPFQQSSRVLETQMRSINSAMKAQETALKSQGTAWDSNSKKITNQKAQYNLTGKAIENYTAQLAKQREKYDGLTESIGDVNNATADQKTQLLSAEAAVNKTVAELERLTNQHNELGKQIAIGESSWTKSGEAMEKFGGKVSSVGDGMSSFGKKYSMGVTAPIMAGAGLVTKAAMDWETDFASVMKTNDEVVDSNGKVVYSYDELEDGLRGLTSTYHSSHSKIAGVAEAAGQLGIETQNVVDFTETMIMLGETTVFSAEDASFALARLANITGMPQTEFRNLGSSLVELGNNFAATEAEIGNMAMNLAAAGTQVGMTEGEILGFAAALSSVGIEAQAGGTAFSKVMIEMQLATETGIGAFDELKAHAEDQGVSWEQLTLAVRNGGKELTDVSGKMGFTSAELRKMYKEADNSKTSLEEFADVAGMTSEQFANLFKENPAEAIMEFVVGLSKAEEQGSSTIKVLDDMGISEVRLRDALLRGANASDLFSDSIRMGNQAYDEGTALADEYAIRQETVAHKLGVVRNQVRNVAIDMGGPFLDAFGNAITASQPLIEKLADLAKKFSELSPETQETIVKTLLYTAAIGPAASITGSFLSKVGGGISTVGNFAKKIGEVSGTLRAKKEALAVASDGTVRLASEVVTATDKSNWFTTSILGAKSGTGLFAKGLGLLTSPLGLTVAALGLGAIAYQTWGKEAIESSRRTREWGTDVGAVTHETLSSVKNDTEAAAGQFGMMAQGFETDSVKMVESVESIGRTIEDSLSRKIEGLKGLLDELPEAFDTAMKSMLEGEIEAAENALVTVQENTQRISEIKANAAKHDRDLSVAESKIIQDLARDTTRAYVETLDVSAEEKSRILDAMNADVENATKEQSKAWLQALGEQRRAAAENSAELRKDMEKNLEALGYNLEGEFAQKFLGAWDDINQTTIDGFDAQMAAITTKYPELINEVSLANGQLINSTSEAGQAMIANNEAIIENSTNLSRRLAKNAVENAEQLAWTADQSNTHLQKGAEIWNKLVFDEKTGEVKSNVNEVVIEATKDSQTWNDLKLLIHDADLDSNAKLIIGEAAIANEWWEGMAWGDKELIINDEASYAVIEALETMGLWQEMEVDEKTALLYSNTPETMRETLISLGLWDKLEWAEKSALLESNSTETMIRTLEDNEKWQELNWEEQLLIANSNTHETLAEAMLNLGLWDDYLPQIKELEAENFGFLSILSQSEEKLASWNNVPDSIKKILGENADFLTTIYESDEVFARWKDVPDSEKIILANNIEFMERIIQSEEEWNRWSSLSDSEKRILGENSDLLAKVFQSEESFNGWNALPTEVKVMLGNNEDILSKVRDGTISVETYNRNVLPHLKTLFGENSDVLNKVSSATSSINSYNRDVNPSTKVAKGDDQASGPFGNAVSAWQRFFELPASTTRTVRADFIGPTLDGRATGDPYFKGGPVWLGDGGKAEPFLTPQGDFGISPPDWTLYDLPRGTKIWPSISKMMETLPRYEHGTSFDDTALSRINDWTTSSRTDRVSTTSTEKNTSDLKKVVKLLEVIARKELVISEKDIASAADRNNAITLERLFANKGLGGI